MRKILFALISFCLYFSAPVSYANDEAIVLKKVKWSFDGLFGRVQENSIQRGLQVYREVCSACHSMQRLPFRALKEVGFSEAETKALAASYNVKDGPNEEGEMFERPAKPSDYFPGPYANEQAARAANNGASPPDLSLIIKARADGANYVYSILTGYAPAPEGFKLGDGMNYNKYFAGHQIAMAAPLSDGQVTYQDGTKATLNQMAYDVVNFLQWVSEPEMQHRKHMGVKVFLFLIVATIIFYISKKRVWSDVK